MVVADDDQPIRRATIVACSSVVSFRQQLGPGMPEDIFVMARFVCDDPNRPDMIGLSKKANGVKRALDFYLQGEAEMHSVLT